MKHPVIAPDPRLASPSLAVRAGRTTTSRFRALALALPLLAAVACSKAPVDVVVGTWEIVPAGEAGSYERLGLVATVRDDGTWEMTGNMAFDAVAGQKKIEGTYSFVSENEIRVEMGSQRVFAEYEPTLFSMQVISRKEIILTTRDQTATISMHRK